MINFRKIVYANDGRFRVIWRMPIFIGLLIIAISPLILIENSTLQFFGAAVILISGLYFNAKFLDKIPFSKYGLQFTRTTLRYFLAGTLIAAVSVCLILGYGYWSGILSLSRNPNSLDITALMIFGFKMLLVALIEESLYRGYFFTNLYESFYAKASKHNLAIIGAVVISSILFGFAHFSNNNASIISISFLTINGIVWCIPFVITKNLGMSIGLHASWNFFQSLFGFTMSGNRPENSIFTLKNTGDQLWSGGNYGPEAGLLGVMGFMTMLFITLGYLNGRMDSLLGTQKKGGKKTT